MSNEDQPVTAASILEMMQAMVGDITKTITNNNDSLRAEINNNNDSLKAEINSNNNNINEKFETMQSLNEASRTELLARIKSRSRLSSRATSSKQLALRHAITLTATIPVVTAPFIVTVLKTPPYLTIPDIGCSITQTEPILSATNITVLESPQQPLQTIIEVPVRTTTAPYDITPSPKSNHASEVVPTDDSQSMDADDFNDQHANSTHQLKHPYPIIIEDNFSNNKCGCFSGDCNGYSDWGTVHVPMTMVLVS